MSVVYAFLADGFEEVEALTVVDLLRRAKIDVKTVSVMGRKEVMGAHQIPVVSDVLFEEADFEAADLLFLPGGMPGTKNLAAHSGLTAQLLRFDQEGKRLSAICAAPSVLGGLGILEGKKATCYPGFESYLKGADYCDQPVVTDGNITTSKGVGTAIALGLELIGILIDRELAGQIAAGIQY